MRVLLILVCIIFSLQINAYALRDPQIPDGSTFSYKEVVKVGEGNKTIKVTDSKTGKTIEKSEIEFPFAFRVSSYTQDNTGFYQIALLDPASQAEIDSDRFQFILRNDLSPVLLSYNDTSKSSGYEIRGKLRWDYPKKVLHYYAKNVFGQKQEINYDVNLKNGLVYGDAISSYPLGLAIMPGFTGDKQGQTIKTLAPYSKMFGMVVVDSSVIVSDKAEHISTPAGEFDCYRVRAVPQVPMVLKPLLFIVGMLDNFEEKFAQTYWVTASAPYITVKYHINVAGAFSRDGMLQKWGR